MGRLLVVEGTHRAELKFYPLILAPVCPQLETKDNVQREGEGEAGGDDRVANLGRGGEQTGETAGDLGNDGERRQLAGALGTIVLADLREL